MKHDHKNLESPYFYLYGTTLSAIPSQFNWLTIEAIQFKADWDNFLHQASFHVDNHDSQIVTKWCTNAMREKYDTEEKQRIFLIRGYLRSHCTKWIPESIKELMVGFAVDDGHVL